MLIAERRAPVDLEPRLKEIIDKIKLEYKEVEIEFSLTSD